MKKIFTRTLYTIACISLVAACKPKLETPSADKGSLDLTTFVAVGNSITAGYADGALYRKGQENSFAKLLAEQLQKAGAGEFKTPYVSENSDGVGSDKNARYALTYVTDCKGVTSLSPRPVATSGDLTIFSTSVYASMGPFNNFGVPGAKAIELGKEGYGDPTAGVGNFNPFFTRMASNPFTTSILNDVVAKQPTFFSLFIGNNDVLLYALDGADSNFISPVGMFEDSVDVIVNRLTANGAKGIVGNIPDITSLPYFTTVPYNGLVLDATQAAQLTAAYSGLGITFQEGANAFMIVDPLAPGGMRQITSSEHVLLSVPQDSLKCAGWGSSKPLKSVWVLTSTEITLINNATTAYNNKLKNAAEAKGLAFVDVNTFLKSAIKGITFDGIKVSTTFVTGGAFSLDGVHLTPLGNALLTNEFVRSINAKYGSTIPEVDITKYHGVVFP